MVNLHPYDPQVFTQLNVFEDARARLKSAIGKMEELGDIIRHYGVSKSVGVSLLHKHFELLPNERLVEGVALENNLQCKPAILESEESISPYMWKVEKKPDGSMRFYPLEYLWNGHSVFNNISPRMSFLHNETFLESFALKLIELEVDSLFGLSVLHRECIKVGKDEMLVETTDDAERTLLFSAVPIGTYAPESLTQTLWQFDALGSVRYQDCNHCFHCSHCNHCSGHPGH